MKDEFAAPELHLGHQNHQLIPRNFSYTYHKTPSFFQREETGIIKNLWEEIGIIKNLPIANVPKQPPTSPEPTQTEGLEEDIIRELEEKHNLRKDPSKARNLESIIKIIYCIKGLEDSPYYCIKRLEDSPYKEAVNTGSTTST